MNAPADAARSISDSQPERAAPQELAAALLAENNEHALTWYRKRNFRKLDAAIFLASSADTEDELLPPKPVKVPAVSLTPLPVPPDEAG